MPRGPKKPNMTVTSRFIEEKHPLSERMVPNPFPNPPPGRSPIGRLAFRGPSAKVDCSTQDLVNAISASLPNAVLFLDTNIFTTHLDIRLWNAFCTRNIFIISRVWNELKPWLKTPFCNQVVRDSLIKAVEDQIRLAGQAHGASNAKSLRVMLDSDCQDFADHAYGYYINLLALRKVMGPLATAVLTKKLGRNPTLDEFNAEVQSRFGERGALLARKGVAASNSPNKLTDEHLVLSAVMTAILRGTETIVVTRDPDLLEQYFKLLCLIKEHYRAMLVAERYASNPSAMNFSEVPVEDDGEHVPAFTGSTFLR